MVPGVVPPGGIWPQMLPCPWQMGSGPGQACFRGWQRFSIVCVALSGTLGVSWRFHSRGSCVTTNLKLRPSTLSGRLSIVRPSRLPVGLPLHNHVVAPRCLIVYSSSALMSSLPMLQRVCLSICNLLACHSAKAFFRHVELSVANFRAVNVSLLFPLSLSLFTLASLKPGTPTRAQKHSLRTEELVPALSMACLWSPSC